MNEKFNQYLEFLTEYNEKVNLVSSTDPEIVTQKHFLDSLAIKKFSDYINFDAHLSVIDIGIGGGFPGIPIIIECPNFRLCAVDSVAKKLEFVRLLADKLGLSDRIEVIAARAEELSRDPAKREAFDLAVTRAVARTSVICEYCLPFVKVGGYFVAYKAKNIEEELDEAQNAISTLGGEVIKTVKYTLSGAEERSLVLIKKVGPTPDKYPRKVGVPAKKPLS